MSGPPVVENTVIEKQDGSGQRAIYQKGHWYPIGANGQAQGAPAAAAPKIAPEDIEALKTMSADALSARKLATRARQFVNTMGNEPTGPAYSAEKVPLLGFDLNPTRSLVSLLQPDSAATLDKLESITNQTWPTMRPDKSGQMRVPEMTGFKKSFPNIVNYGPANVDITNRLDQEADQTNQRLRFAQTMVHGRGGSVADAQAAWDSQIPADPHMATRYAAARNSYYETYLQTKGSLAGADQGWARFAKTRFGDKGAAPAAAQPGPGRMAQAGPPPVTWDAQPVR